MNDLEQRVLEHLREGFYLLAVGKVLEGRREWRRALGLAPGHRVALDYLTSTDEELSGLEQRREQEEITLAASGARVDGRDAVEVWSDEEITSEVGSKWRRRKSEDLEHTLVTPPGERPTARGRTWDDDEPPARAPGKAGAEASAPIRGAPAKGRRAEDDARPSAGRGRDAQDEATTAEGLLGRAVSAFHAEDYAAARAHLKAVLEKDPTSSAAHAYLQQLDERLLEQLHRGAIPERTVGMDEVEGLGLDLVGGYVVSLIDGQTTVDDIYSLSSHLDEADVSRILAQLLEQGIIRLRNP